QIRGSSLFFTGPHLRPARLLCGGDLCPCRRRHPPALPWRGRLGAADRTDSARGNCSGAHDRRNHVLNVRYELFALGVQKPKFCHQSVQRDGSATSLGHYSSERKLVYFRNSRLELLLALAVKASVSTKICAFESCQSVAQRFEASADFVRKLNTSRSGRVFPHTEILHLN